MGTRRTQLFMVPADEEVFVALLRERRADVQVVTGQHWKTPRPPVVAQMSETTASHVFLWSPLVAPVLPAIKRADEWVGPSSGVVIQFERSITDGAALRSGRLAVGVAEADLEMAAFVRDAWAALNAATDAIVRRLDGQSAPYRIGRHAQAWLAARPERYLQDRSVPVRFKVAPPNTQKPSRGTST